MRLLVGSGQCVTVRTRLSDRDHNSNHRLAADLFSKILLVFVAHLQNCAGPQQLSTLEIVPDTRLAAVAPYIEVKSLS